ncbi:hypothetical protein ABZW18_19375 [Streptomyces sp. NPDC004647]|uniref:hypothetical protein n=1 Tax=Streptomyces sp. NPDC004647 TaxID=3154671 RepID=UPI0033B91569
MKREKADGADKSISQGREAAVKLNSALRSAGFTLPTVQGTYPVMGRSMVDLGSASADLITRLAEWIEERA